MSISYKHFTLSRALNEKTGNTFWYLSPSPFPGEAPPQSIIRGVDVDNSVSRAAAEIEKVAHG